MNDPTPTPRQEKNPEARADLVALARFSMDRIPLSVPHRLGLLVVAAASLLLPALYGALIGLLGYGVWYHLTRHYAALASGDTWGQIILYVAPILAGSVATLFLVKPLFAPRDERLKPRTLAREEEPTLFAYVDALCHSLGAPPPHRIDVDMEVEVSASHRRGLIGFLGREPILTLGLPLSGYLTISQWTGLLSHELGPFTPGASTRLRYLIDAVNHWFDQFADERDGWDERMDSWARETGTGFSQVVLLAFQLFAWISRFVLGILGMIAVALSAPFVRRMEFNADLHHARVSGSSSFQPTHVRIQLLAVAWARTNQYLARLWSEHRLVDDVVKLVVADAERLTSAPDVLREIEAQMASASTRGFATDPSTGDRIRAVERRDFPGAVLSDAPASSLFADFEGLSREMTLSLYSTAIERSVEGRTVISAEQALQELDARITGAQALGSYFMGSGLHISGVFPTRPVEATEDVDAARRELAAAREAMTQSLESTRETVHRLAVAGATRTRVRLALELGAAGVEFDPVDLGVETGDRSELEGMLDAARESHMEASEACGHAARESLARLEGAIRLALHPDVRATLSQVTGSLDRLPGFWSAFAAMAPVWDEVAAVQDRADEIGRLSRYANDPETTLAFQEHLDELSRSLCDDLRSIRDRLDDPGHPYDDAQADIGLAGHLLPSIIEPNAQIGIIGKAFVDRYIRLYYRMWSDIAAMATTVEDWADAEQAVTQH